MFRRRELLDLNNREEYRFAISFLHDSHRGPENPVVEFLYHQEFGPPEEFEKSIESLNMAPRYIECF